MKRLFREEEGVTLIEYGLIAALIAIAVIVTLGLVGDALDELFQRIQTALENA
ncbi:MAG: Flp family type IVb pilin [Perlabentimonas sp.]